MRMVGLSSSSVLEQGLVSNNTNQQEIMVGLSSSPVLEESLVSNNTNQQEIMVGLSSSPVLEEGLVSNTNQQEMVSAVPEEDLLRARTNMYQLLTVAIAFYGGLMIAAKNVSRADASHQVLHMQTVIILLYNSFRARNNMYRVLTVAGVLYGALLAVMNYVSRADALHQVLHMQHVIVGISTVLIVFSVLFCFALSWIYEKNTTHHPCSSLRSFCLSVFCWIPTEPATPNDTLAPTNNPA
ncbi:hypothetical protein Tco_0690629 [Tanacetum coccineum]